MHREHLTASAPTETGILEVGQTEMHIEVQEPKEYGREREPDDHRDRQLGCQETGLSDLSQLQYWLDVA